MAKITIPERQVVRAETTGAPKLSPAVAGIAEGANADASRQLTGQLLSFTNELHGAEIQADAAHRVARATTEFNAFYAERSGRPDGFDTLQKDTSDQLGEIRNQAFDGVTDGRTQELLTSRFGALEVQAKGRAASDERRQRVAFANQQTRNTLELNAISAANFDSSREGADLVADSVALLDGQVASGLLSRPVADALKTDFLSQVQVGRFQKLINDDPEQALKILSGKEAIDDLDPGKRNALKRAAQAQVNALASARKKVVDNAVKDALFSLENGFLPANFEAVQRAAEGVPGAESKLNLGLKQYQVVADVSALTPQDQQQWVNRTRARKNLTKPEVQVLKSVESNLAAQRSTFNRNPLQLGIDKGLIPSQLPLDFANADGLPVQLAERRAAAAVVSDHVGQPASPLFAEELDEVKRMLDVGDVDAQADLLGAIVAGLDSDARGFFHQLDSKGSDTYAMMGSLLLRGEKAAALQLGIGRKVLAKDAAAGPKTADFRLEGLAVLDDSYEQLPRTQSTILKNARVLYVGMGGDSESVDTSLMERAINTLTGGLIDYKPQSVKQNTVIPEGQPGRIFFTSDIFGAQRLPAPAPGVTADEFTDWVRNIEPSDIKRFGGVAGYEDAPDQVLRWIWRQDGESRLVGVGQGLYAVEIESLSGSREFLRSADDPAQPFLLDWENLP